MIFTSGNHFPLSVTWDKPPLRFEPGSPALEVDDLPTELLLSPLSTRGYLLEPLLKLRLPLDGSKCYLFRLLIIHTPEALPHGMVQPITAAMLERFQNLNKTSQPNHSYQSM